MANSRIIRFPEKQESKKKASNSEPEKISRELLKELTKDTSYREFTEAHELSKQIGAAIVRARKKSRLSTAELAARIGKSEAIVKRMEKGEYKQYTIQLLLALAHATGSKVQIDLAP